MKCLAIILCFTTLSTLAFAQKPAVVQAASAAALVDSIGVGAQLSYRWDTSYSDAVNGGQGDRPGIFRIADAMRYLGISRMRVGLASDYVAARADALAAAIPGLQFNWVVFKSDQPDALLDRQLARIADRRPITASIEGQNEPNRNIGVQAGREWQEKLWAAVSADPRLHGIPVLAPALGGAGPADYKLLGDLSAYADYGTAHVYYGGGLPPLQGLRRVLEESSASVPGKPVVVTETNYYTAPPITFWGGVDEATQAAYDLQVIADCWMLGVPAVYFYELADEKPDPQYTDLEFHLGLFRADWSPKPAAKAIHNLTRELARDDEQDAPGSLAYSIANLPRTAHSLLFQRGDGVYIIALWNDVNLWNPHKRAPLSPPPPANSVVLKLAQPASQIRVFDPLTGKASQVSLEQDGMEAAISLPPSLILIEVSPRPVSVKAG